MTKQPKISIIVPCYNEEEVLEDSAKSLLNVLNDMIEKNKVSEKSEICLVNDGSQDETWTIIKNLKTKKAGLFTLQSEAFVTIDADLQDDEKVISKMVDDFNGGVDIVYGVRKSRRADSFFKRISAEGFYKLLNFLGVKAVFNHADFRLLSQRAVETLKTFPEKNLFLRAMVPLLGFTSSRVLYDRKPRTKGESKYPFGKMLAFAWDGVTSFSVSPLRLVTIMGLITCFLSFLLICYSIFRWFFGETVLGWTSLVTVVAMFSGVQLISLGIIGEYVGKIYKETKNRPSFIIKDKAL
ncbi:MAG: glycosyltransferase family 2 protein [Candidatus Taylorbacteria bacterium]|nr:glycosyltransferase family 2 protein [Candidatus Taylorbacteria bacterium]